MFCYVAGVLSLFLLACIIFLLFDERGGASDEVLDCTREDHHEGPCNGWPRDGCLK